MREPAFRLRFPASAARRWASRFSEAGADAAVETIGSRVRDRGHLLRGEFLELCRWKTPRSGPRCAENSAATIREATAVALASDDERAKMYILRTLAGVGWPTASVILHFCDSRPYPILDVRALWSAGYAGPPTYGMELWLGYTEFCRKIARAARLDMRTLDRALWQYSKERQVVPPGGSP